MKTDTMIRYEGMKALREKPGICRGGTVYLSHTQRRL